MPKVSVVIPSYNHEKYVAEAIQSVLDQSFQDFEIVITDDASTDRTVEEIKKFNDPRIRFFQLDKNQGGSYTANYCIDRSKGKYIAVLSSDDVFLPDKLEKQVKFLDENKEIGAVFSYAEIIDDDGNVFTDKNHFYSDGGVFKQPNMARCEWLNRFFYRGNCLCHPSVLIRRECYYDVGLYDPRYAQMPDFDMWIRLCMKYEIHIISESLIKFRVRMGEANASGNTLETNARGSWEYSKIMENYLKIPDLNFLLKIFPEIKDLDENPDVQLKAYYVLMLALRDVSYSHTMFALNYLYSLLGDEEIAKKLKSRFSYVDFINLTGSKDPLHVAALMRKNEEASELTESVHRKEKEVKALNGVVVEKEGQIGMLNGVVVEKEGQIGMLNGVVVEKEGQIGMLNGVVVEKDVKIKELSEINSAEKYKIEVLNAEISALRRSYSFRIGRVFVVPVALVCRFFANGWFIFLVFLNFFRHPLNFVKKFSFSNVRRFFALLRTESWNSVLCNVRKSLSQEGPNIFSSNFIVLEDKVDVALKLPKDVAVHAHVFYLDLAMEMRSYLENIPVKFHFYVTTDTLEKVKCLKDTFSNMKNVKSLDVCVTENRGRDILPMLVTLGDKLTQHEIVLHIHTKKSPHNSAFAGWRRYMMESLLGNSQRVIAIFQQFIQDEHLGVLFPDPYHPVKPFVENSAISNEDDYNMERLLGLAGKKKEELKNINRTFFPAGDMFWFRGKAIKPFVDMKLSVQHFEPEEGQVDGTLAHAIERMFPYFAGEEGLITKSYLSNSFLSQQCSAHQINLLHAYIKKGLLLKSTIIFDHDIGGGANIYSRELIKNIIANEASVLRVYNFSGVWVVQWIANQDGMFFYTRSIDELFEALIFSRGTALIVNSLYGCPDIKGVISKILKLARIVKIPIDVKMHDFFAVCQSPHLSNFKAEYCGVPQNHADCSHCLKNNFGWYPSWYPKNNIPVSIAEWRQSFVRLFEVATTLTFFDKSTIEIFRKAFRLEDKKIRVVPHDVGGYFKCDREIDLSGHLRIGVLGTLTHIKGGEAVLSLAEYIAKHDLGVPVIVVGENRVRESSNIWLYGRYEVGNLPEIVVTHGINVVFASSIVPETFSYTISEAMKMGLPIVAFDLGAQGNRVKKYKMGKVIPLGSSPEVILAAMRSILESSKKLKNIH